MAETKDILRYLRKKKGLTQRELADKIGVSYSTIGNYESGIRTPDSAIEELLAQYFDVSIDYLRGRIEGAELSRVEYDKAKFHLYYSDTEESPMYVSENIPFPYGDNCTFETKIGKIVLECTDMSLKQLDHLISYIKLYKNEGGDSK